MERKKTIFENLLIKKYENNNLIVKKVIFLGRFIPIETWLKLEGQNYEPRHFCAFISILWLIWWLIKIYFERFHLFLTSWLLSV